MLIDLRRGAVALVVFTVLVGLAYPLLMFGIGQVAFAAAPRGAWSGGPTARSDPARSARLRRARVLLGPALGRRGRLRRRRLRRLQPGPHPQQPRRHGAGAGRRPARVPPGRDRR